MRTVEATIYTHLKEMSNKRLAHAIITQEKGKSAWEDAERHLPLLYGWSLPAVDTIRKSDLPDSQVSYLFIIISTKANPY